MCFEANRVERRANKAARHPTGRFFPLFLIQVTGGPYQFYRYRLIGTNSRGQRGLRLLGSFELLLMHYKQLGHVNIPG